MTIFSAQVADSLFASDIMTAFSRKQPPVNILNATVFQIRNFVPFLCNRVSGAASYEALRDSRSDGLRKPAAWVVPVSTEMDDQETANGYYQKGTKTLAVIIVATQQQGQLTGLTAIQNMDDIETELTAALAGFRPDPSRMPTVMQFDKASVTETDGAEVWMSFEFSYRFQINNSDVFQPAGVELTGLLVTPAFQKSGGTTFTTEPTYILDLTK